MVSELRRPDLIDPLHDLSILSLLPRTFRDLKKPANSEQGDMELIHTHLKSMAMESSSNYLEQAKNILNSTLELQKPEVPSDDKDDAVAGKAKGRPQERRPGLGRKRARFSLKPNTSQPNVYDNMKLNIDQLQDPEAFFAACEKYENAEKELQRLRGEIPAGSPMHNQSITARRRRPGILGKTGSYKHRYTSVFADSDEAFSSQEMFETDIPSQSSNILNVETTDQQHGSAEEREFSSQGCMDANEEKDSVAEAEIGGISLFDELLSTNCTNLDGDGAVTFLQERLQIKPIKLDKLRLPDLDSLRKSDVTISVEQLHRPRKALSDIDNNVKRLLEKNKTSTKSQMADSSTSQQTSSTSSMSPLSSISLLKKRMSQMIPTMSPFSFRDIDISPPRHISSVHIRDKQDLSPDVDLDHNDAKDTTPMELKRKGLDASGECQSPMLVEDNTAGSSMVSEKLEKENSVCLLDMPLDDYTSRSNTDMDIMSNGPDGVVDDKVECMEHESVVSEQQEPRLEGSPVGNMNYSRSKLGQHIQDDGRGQTADTLPEQNNEVEDMQQETVASKVQELGVEGLPLGNIDCSQSQLDESNFIAGKHQPQNENSVIADILPEQNNEAYQEPSIVFSKEQQKQKSLPCNRSKRREVSHQKSLADEFSSIAVEHLAECGTSQTVNILPEENNETYQEPSTMNLNVQRKRKAPPGNRRKKREVSVPKSLEGAGTKWESGVRRSTRIRTRPLEYWKGERFLYGRVDDDADLTTVIGLKYESPPKSKKDKPAFKVKSYVSDEHKEFVEKAALH